MYDMSFLSEFLFLFILLNIQKGENGIVFLLFICCESNKKLKDPFVKVVSWCLFVPVSDNFQHIKDSYLTSLLF